MPKVVRVTSMPVATDRDAARTEFTQRRFRRNLNGHIVTSPVSHRLDLPVSRARMRCRRVWSRNRGFPTALTSKPSRTSWSMSGFGPVTKGHARLVAQIYAKRHFPRRCGNRAQQLTEMRRATRSLIPVDSPTMRTDRRAFVSICIGYSQQLAVRGDLDPAPFAKALMRSFRDSPISGGSTQVSLIAGPVGQIPTYLASVPTIATAHPAEIRRVIALFHLLMSFSTATSLTSKSTPQRAMCQGSAVTVSRIRRY